MHVTTSILTLATYPEDNKTEYFAKIGPLDFASISGLENYKFFPHPAATHAICVCHVVKLRNDSYIVIKNNAIYISGGCNHFRVQVLPADPPSPETIACEIRRTYFLDVGCVYAKYIVKSDGTVGGYVFVEGHDLEAIVEKYTKFQAERDGVDTFEVGVFVCELVRRDMQRADILSVTEDINEI